MKIILSFLAMGLCLNTYADLITLKDGTRLEGVIEGEMEGVAMVKTRYGTLNINKAEIASQTVQTVPAVSTAPAAVPQAELPAEPAPAPKYTFKTVTLSTSVFERLYAENGAVIATETFKANGELLGSAGLIKDASYREYYDNGNLKTEKTVINSRISGSLKAYYPSGVLQSEAYYADGALNGTVRLYNENAKLLFEQNFKGGTPNGWFKEFDETGALKSELLYADGHIAEKPKAVEAKQTAPAAETSVPMVTVKVLPLARGERFMFYLNNKYLAKLHLDRSFNLISKEGKVPDGTAKAYDKDGKLEKEFLFSGNELLLLKVYSPAGALEGEYAYKENQAVKK
ncbi:MAG: toxin-antitoxin system YwqK family antitoxin [Elusimicrobiales bacterium]|jgi:antitoxin component YwqK of YwqJK toxin-antitoxin module